MRSSQVVVAFLLIATAPAQADLVTSDERDATLTLVDRRIRAELHDGVIHLAVSYDIANTSPIADRARIEPALPFGAQVVGLRQRVGGAWIPGRILDAEVAQARFDAYVDQPFVAARGAVLARGGFGHVELTASFVPPRGRVGIAYDAVMPACFVDGDWYGALPPVDDPRAIAVIGGRQVAHGAAGAPRSLLDTCEFSGDDVILRWPGPRVGVTARVTSVGITGRDPVRSLQVVLGKQLVTPPVRPAVVFVLDASRSVGELDDQLAVVRGYLEHQPDARVEVILTRRHASRLFGAWLPAAAARARLTALAPSIVLGNGSHLERGLALAASVLAGVDGPRRVVAFTDDLLRPSFDDDEVAAALAPLPTDAVVHLIEPGYSDDHLDFLRDHHLAAPIAPWGGIVTVAGASTTRVALRELIVPSSLDDLRVGDQLITDRLHAGEALRHFDRATDAPITAWIWGRPLAVTIDDGVAARTRVAQLALAALSTELSDDDVAALGRIGHAVTDQTSLLAERPSWRPGGLPPDVESMGHVYTSSCGGPSFTTGVSHTYVGTASRSTSPPPTPPDLAPLLAMPIEGCAALLTPGTWRASVAIDTTGDEIVDVEAEAQVDGDPAASARLTACATEAAWQLELPPPFARFTRRYDASYGRP